MKLIFHYRRNKKHAWGWEEWLTDENGNRVENAWVLEATKFESSAEWREDSAHITIVLNISDTKQEPEKV